MRCNNNKCSIKFDRDPHPSSCYLVIIDRHFFFPFNLADSFRRNSQRSILISSALVDSSWGSVVLPGFHFYSTRHLTADFMWKYSTNVNFLWKPQSTTSQTKRALNQLAAGGGNLPYTKLLAIIRNYS